VRVLTSLALLLSVTWYWILKIVNFWTNCTTDQIGRHILDFKMDVIKLVTDLECTLKFVTKIFDFFHACLKSYNELKVLYEGKATSYKYCRLLCDINHKYNKCGCWIYTKSLEFRVCMCDKVAPWLREVMPTYQILISTICLHFLLSAHFSFSQYINWCYALPAFN
jgi:hypothetical protein